MSWSEYWNSNSFINLKILEKWSDYYYKALAELNILRADDIVLDYGAGTGVIAGFISDQVQSVLAYDNSESMNIVCIKNMLKYENVSCSTELNTNQNTTFILINSVLQYINLDELKELVRFASIETQANRMIISDVIPDEYNPYEDAMHNLYYAMKNHFFIIYLLFLIKECIIRILPNKGFIWNKYNKYFLISELEKFGWVVEPISNLSPSVNRYSLSCSRNL
tara:strand:- start:622 stop:1290 length:669 start_codon:yes stop_codon:yes gene_type:complete